MSHVFNSVLATDPESITPVAQVLKAVRKRIPSARRDEVIVGLANGGFPLIVIDGVAYVSGMRLC